MANRIKSGNIPIETAAQVLNMDKQTVRIMIQKGLVPGGACFKLPDSTKYKYVIYAKPFEDSTGFIYQEEQDVTAETYYRHAREALEDLQSTPEYKEHYHEIQSMMDELADWMENIRRSREGNNDI